jgi:toxin YoeB
MGKFRVTLTDNAKGHIARHYKAGNKSTMKKIELLLVELSEHPYTGSGQPEKLKHDLSGFWSRRINQKDRLIYSVLDNIVTVEVISAMGHYHDK